MIVVVDSGVWVSALHFALKRGTPRLAVEKAAREHTIATCDAIEEEVLRILRAKFNWAADDVLVAMHAVFPFPLRVELPGTLRACRDPNDDMVLECAQVSNAHCIVTGDKDLLVMGSFGEIQIVNPAGFLQLAE